MNTKSMSIGKGVYNLKTYGFNDIVIAEHLPDGKMLISYDKLGRPTNDKLVCNSKTAKELKLHLISLSRASNH